MIAASGTPSPLTLSVSLLLSSDYVYPQSPTFSRVKGRSHMKYGREEMSMTARAKDCGQYSE